MPKGVASSSRPNAFVNAPLPSASISRLSGTLWFFAQAPITKASLTDRQATSMPRRENSSSFST